uniref:YDG domain-containing protein n=1 Tax=Angiostrongylus cantonensis TaxID=6313 RepID=A0A0K0DDL5_ANGCA
MVPHTTWIRLQRMPYWSTCSMTAGKTESYIKDFTGQTIIARTGSTLGAMDEYGETMAGTSRTVQNVKATYERRKSFSLHHDEYR